MFVLPPDLICYSPRLPGLSPSLFSLLAFKLKRSGVTFIQNKTGVEFLASLADQPFKDRRTTGTYQVTDVIFREMYAADFTKYVETTGFMSALGYLGIDADTLLSAFWAAVDRIGLLFGSK